MGWWIEGERGGGCPIILVGKLVENMFAILVVGRHTNDRQLKQMRRKSSDDFL